MISFIIIGKNEEENLSRCFNSILETIEYNKLKEYEIIYVDSNSTDNSIEVAKSYNEIKIFKITGVCNAAIGRNIGAKESKGNVLFFIDGDMEIIPNFLPIVYNKHKGLKNNFVSGDFENNYYNNEGKFLYKKKQFNLFNDTLQVTTGGLFLIKKELWESVNGIKTKYRVNEDLDLGLRLSKRGIKLLRKKEILAIHHTISYRDKSRIWKMLFSGQQSLRAVLYRDHAFNRNIYPILFRNDYTLLILIISSILMFTVNTNAIIVYPFVVILRILFQKDNKSIINIIMRIPFYFIRDVIVLISFLIYYPKNIQTSYEKIRDK